MKHPDRFLTSLKEAHITIVQDYPDDCVPIRRVMGEINQWTSVLRLN